MEQVVIVGASHAGSQLALSLRQQGWTGKILLIGAEPNYPYQRPPLSKDFLSGNKQVDDLLIRPAALYEKNKIELLLNTQVKNIDRASQQLSIVSSQGQEQQLAYHKLALCTGANVRTLTLTGANLKGVHYLRNLNDVEHIRSSLVANGRGVIIGGGYIGLETAAMLSKMGQEITVLEAAPQLLGRVAAPELGNFYHSLHQHHGVRIQLNSTITCLQGTDKVEAVVLADGSAITADYVIIGIGVVPNMELAEEAGLETNDGIVVNSQALTSDADIYAAGDCTRFQHPIYGDIRLESVPNATEQAKVAAATIAGKEASHQGLPWFWSDQYDCKLQIAGISRGFDAVIVRGEPSINQEQKTSFCVFYFQDERLIAADCINRPKEFMLAKMWLQNQHTPDRGKLKDDNYSLSRDD